MANPIKSKLRSLNSRVSVPYSQGSDIFGFYQSWINSPEYKQRLINNGYTNPEQVIDSRYNAINNLNISYDHNLPNVANAPATHNSQAYVNVNPVEANQLGTSVDSVKAHEISHAIGAKGGIINRNVGFNPIEETMLRNSVTRQQPTDPIQQAHWRHLNNPEEIKADLDASRYNLFKNNIYDIRQGQPFTQDHLNKAKEGLKNDGTFNRLIEQVGDDNYINLMNGIASNNTNNNNVAMAKYGGTVNPVQQFFLGGAFNEENRNTTSAISGLASGLIPQHNKDGLTSVGGSTASSALQGLSIGAQFGPIGAGIGLAGGAALGLITGSRQRKEQEQQLQLQRDAQSREMLANMNYGVGQASNLPMANGGSITSNGTVNPIGSFTLFENGGTHEQNPYGGIPQGYNSQGQLMTTEESESKFKFSDSDYIFSNRLKYE